MGFEVCGIKHQHLFRLVAVYRRANSEKIKVKDMGGHSFTL